MRYIIACILGLSSLMLVPTSHAFSVDEITEAPYDDWNNLPDGEDAANIGKQTQKDAIDDDESAVQKILNAFKINYNQTQGEEQLASFFIKQMINYFLAIAGFVAVVVLIIGFYRMFAAGDNEEGYKSAMKIVVRAGIAIIVIGISWFIVSWFFDVFIRVKDTT